MKTIRRLLLGVLFAMVLLLPRAGMSQRWDHGRGYERERFHPRAYPVVPLPFVPVPRVACPVTCHSVNVCNGYGWCHWERHCEPWCG